MEELHPKYKKKWRIILQNPKTPKRG